MEAITAYHHQALIDLIAAYKRDDETLAFLNVLRNEHDISTLELAARAIAYGRESDGLFFLNCSYISATYLKVLDENDDYQWLGLKFWVEQMSNDWMYVSSISFPTYRSMRVRLKFRSSEGARNAARRTRLKRERVWEQTKDCYAEFVHLFDKEFPNLNLHCRFKAVVGYSFMSMTLVRTPISTFKIEHFAPDFAKYIDLLKFAALQAKYEGRVDVEVAECVWNRIDFHPIVF